MEESKEIRAGLEFQEGQPASYGQLKNLTIIKQQKIPLCDMSLYLRSLR